MKRLIALAAIALSLFVAACGSDGATGAPGVESNSLESPAISSPGVSSAEPVVSPSASPS